MNIYREVNSLLCAIAQSHGCNHIALGSDAHTCTAAHATLALNLLPKMHLCALHLKALWVNANLFHYLVNLLKLKVNDVVHDALCGKHMLTEQFIVEICILGKWINNV